MGWLGLDDTDTVAGGCTTFVFHQLLENLPENVSVAETRLVRLWPLAKKRTRGNAAMAAELVLLDDDNNVIIGVSNYNDRGVYNSSIYLHAFLMN